MDQHLDFEQPIYTCLEKIEELKNQVFNIIESELIRYENESR